MLVISGFGMKNLTLAAFAWSGTFFPLPNPSHLTYGLLRDFRVNECPVKSETHFPVFAPVLSFQLCGLVSLDLWIVPAKIKML